MTAGTAEERISPDMLFEVERLVELVSEALVEPAPRHPAPASPVHISQ